MNFKKYLSSLKSSYGLEPLDYMGIVQCKTRDTNNTYLLLFKKFVVLLEDSVDTTKYSDYELLDLLRMVKVVYDLQVSDIGMKGIEKLQPSHVHLGGGSIVFTPDAKVDPDSAVQKQSKKILISDFIKDCNEMFLMIILNFKK